MYPIVRLILTSLKAQRASKKSALDYDAIGKVSFYTRPWDLDMFMEMNNGRVLTLYDLGRFDFSIRCGLIAVLRQKKWGLAVAGSTVRYRKRVRLFDKVTMHSQMVGMDDRWIYIAQSMWVKGEPTSSVVLRTCITEKGRSVPTQEVRNALELPDWNPELPGWVDAWDQADKERPWPPKP